MNLATLGQVTDEFDPLEEEEGMTATSEEDVIPEPPVNRPVLYRHRLYSDTKSNWEMLTGLRFSTSSPEEIADRFRTVVRKHLVGPVQQQRRQFGPWQAYRTDAPTAEEQFRAEKLLDSGDFEVVVGTIIEGVDPNNPQIPMMHVDYYGVVEPGIVRSELPESPAAAGLSNRTKTVGLVGLGLGGAASMMLVKKGFGLKLLAGIAGGVIVAGVFMRASQAMEENGEKTA